MSKKVLNYAGRRPMLLALIMATAILGLLFSGWFTPTSVKAQSGGGNPQANQENTNCVPTTNAWSGTCPTVITNGSVSPTSICVTYSNAPTMPTNIISPVYSPSNIFTQVITYDKTNCTPVTNTENVTYSVGGVFWTNFSSPYTNFPAHVTNTFSADADVYVTSSDTNNCSSPGLVNLGTVTWNVINQTKSLAPNTSETINAYFLSDGVGYRVFTHTLTECYSKYYYCDDPTEKWDLAKSISSLKDWHADDNINWGCEHKYSFQNNYTAMGSSSGIGEAGTDYLEIDSGIWVVPPQPGLSGTDHITMLSYHNDDGGSTPGFYSGGSLTVAIQ